MAVIYDISTGSILHENTGVTRLDDSRLTAESNTALQILQTDAATAQSAPCDDYMTIIQQLLKEL